MTCLIVLSIQIKPSLNFVVPTYYLILNICKPIDSDCSVISSLKLIIKEKSEDKILGSITSLHWLATFLDPNFKDLSFIDDSIQRNLKKKRNNFSN